MWTSSGDCRARLVGVPVIREGGVRELEKERWDVVALQRQL